MRTAISRSDICLVLWHDGFERTGEGDVDLRPSKRVDLATVHHPL